VNNLRLYSIHAKLIFKKFASRQWPKNGKGEDWVVKGQDYNVWEERVVLIFEF